MTKQEPSSDAFQIAIEFSTKDTLELTVLPSTTIGEIRQVVFQSSRANFLTCFNIEFEGLSLVDNVDLSSILGSSPNVLTVTAAEYTEHEIRIHINRVREVLTGLHAQYSLYGLNQSISFTSAIVGGSLVDEKIATSEVPIIGDIETLNVKEFIPRNVRKENLQCLKSLSMSNWNPPPLNLKMRGELLYLAVETLEGLSFQISCTVHGFFVNQSTNVQFDARKSSACSQTFQTLPELLNSFSEGFKVNFTELQHNLNLRHPFEYLVTSKPSYPWAVDTQDLPNHAIALDSELAAFEILDTLCARDWNEDIQSARELPKGNAGESVLRDQAIFRCYAEFTDAALKGAMAITNGSILPINVSSDEKSKIFIHNNIFFSVGYDNKDQFEAYGGDEAAHVAISKDLDGITTVENNEIDGVHTLATVLIDFKGNRIIAQSIVPGILKQNSDASSVIYGSIDGGNEIMSSEIVEDLAAEVCKSLHLKRHTVLDSNNVSHDLFTSQDTKWVKGTDSRFYILDLFRLHPIDSLFLEKVKEQDIENRYPHEMVLLRPELIALFHEHKMNMAMKESGKSYDEVYNSCLTSLNPDYLTYAKNAYSEDQKEIDKKVANEASEFLLLMISQYFLNIVQYAIAIPVETVSLTNSMHKRGINMRYLGKLAELIDGHKEFKVDAFKILLQEEMIARVSKKMLRILIRNLPLYKTPACIANFLSDLFKIRSNITSPLKTKLTEEIKSRFRYDIPERYWNEKTISLLRSICLKVGIQIKAQAYDPAQVPLIEESSILNLVPVLKFYQPSAGLAPDAMLQGRACISQGKNDLGLDLMQESVSMFEQVFGPINSETGRAYANLAMAYFDINERALSLRAQIKAAIVAERTFGTDSPETLRQYATLGYFMCANENYSAGIRLVQFALTSWKFHLQGKDHPELCSLLANFGLLLQKGGNTDESIAILSQNLISTKFIYGPDSVQVAAAHELLMRSYHQQGNYKQALVSQRSAFMIYKSLLGETHEQTVNSVNIMKTLTAKAVDAVITFK